LTFEEPSEAMKRKTDAVARSITAAAAQVELAPGFSLLGAVKKAQIELRQH
jgi:carbon-monoxide dehydrogenase iron sulfur subunit